MIFQHILSYSFIFFHIVLYSNNFVLLWLLAFSLDSSTVESTVTRRSTHNTYDDKCKIHYYAATDSSLVCTEHITRNACSALFTAHPEFTCILPFGDIWHEGSLFVKKDYSIMVYDPNESSNLIHNAIFLLEQKFKSRKTVII